MEFLTTEQAAERLGVGARRVQALVQAGRLPASRFGRALMIREEDLALVADRKWGRPSKSADSDGQPAEEAPAKPVKKARKATAKKGRKS